MLNYRVTVIPVSLELQAGITKINTFVLISDKVRGRRSGWKIWPPAAASKRTIQGFIVKTWKPRRCWTASVHRRDSGRGQCSESRAGARPCWPPGRGGVDGPCSSTAGEPVGKQPNNNLNQSAPPGGFWIFLELNRCVYLGAVVSLWIRARVPALLLRVGDGLQVARDGRAAVVETLETVFWEDQDLDALREKEKKKKTFRMLRTVITLRLI